MRKIFISEKQFNVIKLLILSLLLIISIGGTILYKNNVVTYSAFNAMYSGVLYFILIPIAVLLHLMQWFGVIPNYQSNPLSLFWPNFTATNYPAFFKFFKIFNVVFIILLFIWAYLYTTHKI